MGFTASSSAVNGPSSESISPAGIPISSFALSTYVKFIYGSKVSTGHPTAGTSTIIAIGICMDMPALKESIVIRVVSASNALHPVLSLVGIVSSKTCIPHGTISAITISVPSTLPWLMTLTEKMIVSPLSKVPSAGILLGSTVLVRAKSNTGSISSTIHPMS